MALADLGAHLQLNTLAVDGTAGGGEAVVAPAVPGERGGMHHRFQLYSDTSLKHPTFLAEAIAAQGLDLPSPSARTSSWLLSNQDGILRYLAHLNDGRSESHRDRLRDVFSVAQTWFALLDCRAPRHEDSLTGSLISRLGAATMEEASDDLTGNPLQLWTIELILSGREQEVGADLALIVEVDGHVFVSCLQAKRRDPPAGIGIVTLSQPRRVRDKVTRRVVYEDHLWQLRAMRRMALSTGMPISCGYLFYNNGKGGTRSPVLPLVKRIGDLEPDVETTEKTNLDDRTVDLASHMVRLMDAKEHAIEASALNIAALADLLAQERVRHIVYAGSAETFEYRLRRSFADDPYVEVTSSQVRHQSLDRPPPRPSKALRWPDHLANPEPREGGQAPGGRTPGQR